MRKGGSRGFSLLELVIVLVILSLATLLVAPRLSRTISHMETKGAAKRVSALLRHCRSDAINQKKTYQISFDAGANAVSISVLTEGEDTPKADRSYVMSKEVSMEKVETAKSRPLVRTEIEIITVGMDKGGYLLSGCIDAVAEINRFIPQRIAIRAPSGQFDLPEILFSFASRSGR